MVLVTQNQYILAAKINHITMDEQIQHQEVRSTNGRYKTRVDRYFQITVIYTPEASQNQQNFNSKGHNGEETRECSVILRGHVHAHNVFTNLIQQIREQLPDQLYLDTALERMIAGTDIEGLKGEDRKFEDSDSFMLEAPSVKSSSKKVRATGKAKRASKKVLRGTKRKR